MSVAEAAIVSLSTLVFFDMMSRYLTMRIHVRSALKAYLRANGVSRCSKAVSTLKVGFSSVHGQNFLAHHKHVNHFGALEGGHV